MLEILIVVIAFAVSHAVLAGISVICYRIGRATSPDHLDATIARIEAGTARTEAKIASIRAGRHIADVDPVQHNRSGTMKLDRITATPEVCRGRARVRGTRITVDFVLKLMGNGYTPAEVVDAYPALSLADVRQCAAYGAWLASESWVDAAAYSATPIGGS